LYYNWQVWDVLYTTAKAARARRNLIMEKQTREMRVTHWND